MYGAEIERAKKKCAFPLRGLQLQDIGTTGDRVNGTLLSDGAVSKMHTRD